MPTTETDNGRAGTGGDLLAVGLPLLLLYLATVSHDLGTIDSGELAVVCARLGIAHPTGYPLYTIIGRLAVLLLPASPIMSLNLLSAFICLAAALLTVPLARQLGLGQGRSLAWGAGLWLGTSRVFWDQATGNEVYGLHMLLVILLLRQAARLLSPEGRPRHLLLLAWLLGLAFAHHLSVVFLLPALAWAAWAFLRALPGVRITGKGRRLSPWWLVPISAAALVLAWSLMLYLPIRASRGPVLDWGDPATWARFWRHVLAAQYRVWFFESGRLWWNNLAGYFRSLPGRLSWAAILLAPVGLGGLLRGRRPVLPLLALAWAFTLVYVSSYDIHDLAPYYLPADLVTVLWALFGAESALGFLFRRTRLGEGRARGTVRAGVILGLAALQGGLHFREADRHADHFVRAHVQALLQSLPPRTVLLSRHWDAVVSPLLYLQEVEGVRRDVTVVDTELLRRSWYYPQLRRSDPTILAPMEDRVRAFLEQCDLFERGRAYDASRIESCYRAVIQGIAGLHRPARLPALTADEDPVLLDKAVPVPEGLAYVYREEPAATPRLDPPDPGLLIRAGYRPKDEIHRQVIEIWVRMFRARVQLLERLGRASEAAPWTRGLETLEGMPAGRPGQPG